MATGHGARRQVHFFLMMFKIYVIMLRLFLKFLALDVLFGSPVVEKEFCGTRMETLSTQAQPGFFYWEWELMNR